jgi:hypothetical protein
VNADAVSPELRDAGDLIIINGSAAAAHPPQPARNALKRSSGGGVSRGVKVVFVATAAGLGPSPETGIDSSRRRVAASSQFATGASAQAAMPFCHPFPETPVFHGAS